MKERVEVAAVQIDISRDVHLNLNRMRSIVAGLAAEGHIDLVVFPELANCGYIKGWDRSFWREYVKMAERIPGAFTTGLGEMAKKHHIFVVAGMLEAHPSIPATAYNSAVLVGPTGDVLGVHRKMHLPKEEKHYFYPGSTFQVVATELGNIGFQVCADALFPELTRILTLMGAEIVCSVVNAPRSSVKSTPGNYSRATGRAMENTVFFIACNRVGVEDGVAFYGGSAIAAPNGQLIVRSPMDVQDILRATLWAEVLERERVRRPILAALRPELYRPIAERY